MKQFYASILLIFFCSVINAQCPSVTVTPVSRTITCNGAPGTFTSICSPTLATTGQWFGPGGGAIAPPSNSPVILNALNPGTYTIAYTNIFSACVTTQTVLVVPSASVVPSMTINAISGYTLSCTGCLLFNVNASSGPAPSTYSWTNNTTSVTTVPIAGGGYTICPGSGGSFTVEHMDGNLCRVYQDLSLKVIACTGISEIENNENVTVQPNPSNGHFDVNITATLENADLKIMNNLGQEIMIQKVSEGINPVNTSGMAPGIYHYTIVKDKKPFAKGKLVVQ